MRSAVGAVLAAAVVVASVQQADAHAKFHCPVPRTQDSGLKNGSCGNKPRGAVVAQLAPGPQSFHFEETIIHTGAPYRIALSTNNDDNFESCILLNHIPHATDNGEYYTLTVDIPDIDCPTCTLQLIQVMTDKIQDPTCTFNPDDTTSFANGQCGSNYFSCVDVAITGTTPVADFVCPAAPADWPYAAKPKYTYDKGHSAIWAPANGGPPAVRTLSGVPAKYTTLTGFCAQQANLPGNVPAPTPAGGAAPVPAPAPGSPQSQDPADSASEDDSTLLYVGLGGGAVVLAVGAFAYSRRAGQANVQMAQGYPQQQQGFPQQQQGYPQGGFPGQGFDQGYPGQGGYDNGYAMQGYGGQQEMMPQYAKSMPPI